MVSRTALRSLALTQDDREHASGGAQVLEHCGGTRSSEEERTGSFYHNMAFLCSPLESRLQNGEMRERILNEVASRRCDFRSGQFVAVARATGKTGTLPLATSASFGRGGVTYESLRASRPGLERNMRDGSWIGRTFCKTRRIQERMIVASEQPLSESREQRLVDAKQGDHHSSSCDTSGPVPTKHGYGALGAPHPASITAVNTPHSCSRDDRSNRRRNLHGSESVNHVDQAAASNTVMKPHLEGSSVAPLSLTISRRVFLSLPLLLFLAHLWKPAATRATTSLPSKNGTVVDSGTPPRDVTATTSVTGEIRTLFTRAQRFEDQGQIQEALAVYSSVLEREPGLVWAYANRANLYSRQGRYDDALRDYTRAIRLLCQAVSSKETEGEAILTNPDAPCLGRELWVLYLNRGTVYRTLRRSKEALQDLNRALSIRPYEPLLLVNRAMVYVDQAKYDAALLDYQRAVERRPGDVQPFWVDYALTLFQRGRDTDAFGIMRRVASKPGFAQSDDVKAAFAVILYDRGMLSDAEGLWGALERPRRFQDENFLRNERRWPPRAVEVALRYHPPQLRRATPST